MTGMATIPQTSTPVEAIISNTTIADLRMSRVIFFAGNDLSPQEQFEMPEVRGFGGKALPHIRTLVGGMLYRCKLTPLRPKMIPENSGMLAPAQREGGVWQKSYMQDGKLIKGFMGSDPNAPEGEFVPQLSDHLSYREWYPGGEIGRATERSQPNGVGGVVEVADLKGATNAEIDAVQLFFFPEWLEIIQGYKSLPDTIRETEGHIKFRIKCIDTEVAPDDRQKYRRIGNAMLQSCSEYRRTGTDLIHKDETAAKAAFTKGEVQASHSPVSTVVLEALEQRRKEDVTVGESSSVDRLAREMAAERAANHDVDDKRFLLEDRKQYTAEVTAGLRERDTDEEVRLGMRKPQTEATHTFTTIATDYLDRSGQNLVGDSPDDIVELPLTPNDVTFKCGATKADLTACQRNVDNEGGKCWSHDKSDAASDTNNSL